MEISYPKISVVTPSFNQAQFLEKTVRSVIDQQYPNLEYIIVDGGSSDGSLEIIKKYQDSFAYWVSEPDNGMYDAIQKGFDKSSGELMCWINSDDLLMPNALFTVAGIFKEFEEIDWLLGRPSFVDEQGTIVKVSDLRRWSKYDFALGYYKWIQQESVFWRRSLWEKAGGLDSSLKYAGDFELWCRFFRFNRLFTTDAVLGTHRTRKEGQKSAVYLNEYLLEVKSAQTALKDELEREEEFQQIQKIHRILNKLKHNNILKSFGLVASLEEKLNKQKKYPHHLVFSKERQKFIIP